MMIVVGANSQLGLAFTKKLNQNGFNYLVLVDNVSSENRSQHNDVKFWQHLSVNELWQKAQDKYEEIEFIFWCKNSTVDRDYTLLEKLWSLGHREQIPIIAVAYENSKSNAPKHLSHEAAPFFWAILRISGFLASEEKDHSILLSGNSKYREMSKTLVREVVNIMYFFLHLRKNSGSYLVPFQLIQESSLKEGKSTDSSKKEHFPVDNRDAVSRLQEIGYQFLFNYPEGN